MPSARAEVDAALDTLRGRLPQMIIEFSSRERLWTVLAAYIAQIMSNTPLAGQHYVRGEIDAMLLANGLEAPSDVWE